MKVRNCFFSILCIVISGNSVVSVVSVIGVIGVLFLASPALACPERPSSREIMKLFSDASEVTALQFIKVEKEASATHSWRFKVSATLKSAPKSPKAPISPSQAKSGTISFFTKPDPEAPGVLKFNDRFLTFSTDKSPDLGTALKTHFLSPEGTALDFCLIRSSVYLEDFIKRTASTKSVRDGTCQIQLKTLESLPTIKDAFSFRCENPELDKRRLILLANAFARAKRYGNAVTALELSNGTLNASTLAIALDWADEWESKDDRAAKRFVERIMSRDLRQHFEKSNQMLATTDILANKKRYSRLRDTDWFDPLVTSWTAKETPMAPKKLIRPAKKK